MSYLYGLDVDHNQKVIDWNLLKEQGFSFVYIKATQACFHTTTFKSHWQGAKEAGFLRGAYHFMDYRSKHPLYCKEINLDIQINNFLNTIGNDPGELPPALDVEQIESIPLTNPAKYIHETKQWLAAIEEKLGRTPVIYTRATWWDDAVRMDYREPFWSSKYRVWLAHYMMELPIEKPKPLLEYLDVKDLEAILVGVEEGRYLQASGPETGKTAPRVPNSWRDTGWTFWQISGDKYYIKGVDSTNREKKVVPAGVDINIFNGSMEDLYAMTNVTMVDHNKKTAGIDTQEKNKTGIDTDHKEPNSGLPTKKFTNQAMINAFERAFGDKKYWQMIERLNLGQMANQRQKTYSGPDIQELSLSEAEKASLTKELLKKIKN